MVRMRFTKQEREAFHKDAEVEWRNGRHWHPGVVIDGVIHKDQRIQHILIRNRATRGTSTGFEVIHGTPAAVRVPQGE